MARKSYGTTWWGKRWLESLSDIDFANRIPRGRTYANTGRVYDVVVEPERGRVRAKVEGACNPFYHVTLMFEQVSEADKNALMSDLVNNMAVLSKLTNRELDPCLLDIALKHDIKLFPTSWKDINMRCDCPDFAVPCKHIAAVIYIVSEIIDSNPFIIFNLKGIDLLKEVEERGINMSNADKVETVSAAYLHSSANTSLQKVLAQAQIYEIPLEPVTIERIVPIDWQVDFKQGSHLDPDVIVDVDVVGREYLLAHQGDFDDDLKNCPNALARIQEESQLGQLTCDENNAAKDKSLDVETKSLDAAKDKTLEAETKSLDAAKDKTLDAKISSKATDTEQASSLNALKSNNIKSSAQALANAKPLAKTEVASAVAQDPSTQDISESLSQGADDLDIHNAQASSKHDTKSQLPKDTKVQKGAGAEYLCKAIGLLVDADHEFTNRKKKSGRKSKAFLEAQEQAEFSKNKYGSYTLHLAFDAIKQQTGVTVFGQNDKFEALSVSMFDSAKLKQTSTKAATASKKSVASKKAENASSKKKAQVTVNSDKDSKKTTPKKKVTFRLI